MSDARSDPIRLIVFDLGRVLVKIADDWADAGRRAGIRLPPSLADADVERRLHRLAHAHETGVVDDATFFRRTAAATGLLPAQVEAVSRAWIRGPCDGADELLADLSRDGVGLACLSNTNPFHWSLMWTRPSTRRLLERLEQHFASHELRACKPEPRVYEHVERETGRAGAEILYFDDHLPNVAAAAARGWRAVSLSPGEPPVVQMRRVLRRHGIL